MKPNTVKRALIEGQVQVGTWVNTLATPKITQVLATAGFDFIYIDMEHSGFSIETVTDLCFAALSAGLVPIVRPPAKDAHLLSRPLDGGAMGLLVPHVDTPQEARAVIQAVKYPPWGERGLSLRGVHTGFGQGKGEEYTRTTNVETLVLVQLESKQALENIDKILSIEGIDGAVIGRGDLSIDLGVPGQTEHPEVLRGVDRMIAACRHHNKIPGLLVQTVASAREWIAKGIRLVPYSNEVAMLMNTATDAVAQIRPAVHEQT
jgi:4-hydroxy-2-oxoheptanedioate aldolase